MTLYRDWARRHPQAAAELEQLQGALPWATNEENAGKSENWAQQQIRFQARQQGAQAWRNNVGAAKSSIKTTCPRCQNPFQIKQQPIRWGLANDSMQLNAQIKSSDLILAIPRIIRPEHVGQKLAQFGSVEVKKPGWKYSGNEHEQAQSNWLSLISSMGGFACFSTGDLQL
jgi:hypothetical protein